MKFPSLYDVDIMYKMFGVQVKVKTLLQDIRLISIADDLPPFLPLLVLWNILYRQSTRGVHHSFTNDIKMHIILTLGMQAMWWTCNGPSMFTFA